MSNHSDVYRVIVGTVDGEPVDQLALTLREQGHEVVSLGQQESFEPVVVSAVQEDADVVTITADQGTADTVRDYLTDRLEAYDAEDVLVTVEYEDTTDYWELSDWCAVDGVGETNAEILADAELDPDTASYTDIEDALIDGYTEQYDNQLTGVKAGRGQAKMIRTYNPERFDDDTGSSA